jgi:hypothetical protein
MILFPVIGHAVNIRIQNLSDCPDDGVAIGGVGVGGSGDGAGFADEAGCEAEAWVELVGTWQYLFIKGLSRMALT